jgi:hypothetical protein
MRSENIFGIGVVYISIGVSHVSKPARCVGDFGPVSVWHV